MTKNNSRIADEFYHDCIVTVTGDLKNLIMQSIRDKDCGKGWEETYRYILEKSTKGKICPDPRFKRFVVRLGDELYILRIQEGQTSDGKQKRIKLMLADEGEDLMRRTPVVTDLREIALGDCQEIYPDSHLICSFKTMEIIKQHAGTQGIEATIRRILLASRYTSSAFGKPLTTFGVDLFGELLWFQLRHGTIETGGKQSQTITFLTTDE